MEKYDTITKEIVPLAHISVQREFNMKWLPIFRNFIHYKLRN